jgi:hypothetical protein
VTVTTDARAAAIESEERREQTELALLRDFQRGELGRQEYIARMQSLNPDTTPTHPKPF